MARSIGTGGDGTTNKDSRGGETVRAPEKERPQLKWEDCVKRDVRKADRDEQLRERLSM